MRVLLIADAGDGLLDLALRSQRVGHQVRMFVRKFDRNTRPIGKGLVELVDNWRYFIHWADLVVLETNGVYMGEMDVWRSRGVAIIGGNEQSARWELDRSAGMNVFQKAGIAVPTYREFNDYDTAIAFVERRGEVLYSKPCSDTAEKSLSAKTGVPEDPTYQLRRWRKKHGRPPCPFLLQEAIEGTEFAVGGWWGPAGWADVWEENHEFKRFCSGDIGPNTGEMGTVLRFVRRSKLAEMVLKPLEPQLERLGDIALNVDVNCIISDDGTTWPLEFTMRCGWPAFNIETDLFECDPLEFLYAVAAGEQTRGAHLLNQPAVGTIACVPPYPHPPRDYDEIVGIPIFGIDDEDHFHPCEVMAGSNSKYATAGHYVGVAVGVGDTVRQGRRGSHKVLDKLSMPGSPFWRVDIGQRLQKDIPALNEHGFAIGLEW